MTQKIRVIVTKLPKGCKGADEGIDALSGTPIISPDVLKLDSPFGGPPWRARLSVSTPIPPEFIDGLERSGAEWAYVEQPDDIVGAPV